MALINVSVPNLINGISQQPNMLRLPSQGEVQENAISSITRGLTKRPGTNHIAQISTSTITTPYIHTIARDSLEKYIVIIADNLIKVYDLEGSSETVTFPYGTDYLASTQAATDFRATTVADTTFILNKTISPIMADNLTSNRPFEAIVNIKAGYYSQTYTIVLNGRAYNFYTPAVGGSADDIKTTKIASDMAAFLTSTYGPGVNYEFAASGSSVHIRKLDGTEFEIWVNDSYGDTAMSCISSTVQRFTDLPKIARHGMVTQILGDDTSQFDNYYVQFEADVETPITYGTTSLAASGTATASLESGTNTAAQAFNAGTATAWHTPTGTTTGYIQYARVLQSNIRKYTLYAPTSSSPRDWTFSGSTDGTTFAVLDSQYDQLASTSTVEYAIDCPTIYNYFRLTVTKNNGGTDLAITELKWYSATEVDTSGTWVECPAPLLKKGFDNRTMPHALTRQGDGSFIFAPIDWDDRAAGDDLLSPEPSFIGDYINEIFFWKNRLCFLSSENVIMSKASFYYTFWRDTALQILDSDPIDVATNHPKVSILRHAILFQEGSLVFSDQTQFFVSGGEILSPKTVAISATTTFTASRNCAPTSAGRYIFFAIPRGDYDGVMEYRTVPGSTTQDATDITAHVPNYIPANITKFTGSTSENILVAITDGDKDSMYVYKYYWSDETKLQASWSKFILDSDTEVVNVEFIESTLYIITKQNDGMYLSSMYCDEGRVDDTSSGLTILLDRRLDQTQVSSTYSTSTENTTFTLPYKPSDTIQVIGGGTENLGISYEVLTQSTASTSVIVEGSQGAKELYIGQPYTMLYSFSEPTIRRTGANNSSQPVTEGRVQVRTGLLAFADSGAFDIEVTPDYRDKSTHTFSGRLLGSGSNIIGQVAVESGTFRFPVQSRNDRVEINIVCDTFLPVHFLNVTWEMLYHARSTAM